MATTTPIRSVSKTITPAGTNYMLLDDGISMGKATLDDGVAAVADGLISDAIDALNLGTASQSAATDFATAAQGATADTAVQPGDLGPVATSNDYGDLDNLPTLGTAAAEDAAAFATSAQGALADTAFQPADAPNDANLSNDPDKLALRGNVGANVTAKTVTAAAALTPATAPDFIQTAGYASAGDGGGALYKKAASEPTHEGKFSITLDDGVTVVWYEIAETNISVAHFGAGPAATTAVNQQAFVDAIAAAPDGGTLAIPDNWSLIVDQITIDKALTLTGRNVLITRSATSTANSLLLVSGGEKVSIKGIVFDGNKDNNANPCAVGRVSGAGDIDFERCTFRNGKASAGYGEGLVIDQADSGYLSLRIANNIFHDNDGTGVYIPDANNITITDNRAFSNGGSGISLNNYDTTLTQKINYMIVSRNRCSENAGAGISAGNFIQDNVISVSPRNYGYSDYEASFGIISENICESNEGYGIACYGQWLNISDNLCRNNGTGTGGSGGGNFSVQYSIISGNTVIGSYFWGFDCGGTRDSLISGNFFQFNGIVYGQSVPLNIGGGAGNKITNNVFRGNTGRNIVMIRYESDGLGGNFPSASAQTFISGNKFQLDTGVYGITVRDGAESVVITDNEFLVADSTLEKCVYCIARSAIIRNNIVDPAKSRVASVDGSGILAIPDVLDNCTVNAAATINGIKTTSMTTVGTGLPYATVTAAGSGYTSEPTVTITGDGSGAVARARIRNGSVLQIDMQSYGTGYTTATISISGGGGSGAAATVQVGLPLLPYTEKFIYFNAACTLVKPGSPPISYPASGNLAVPAYGSVTLYSPFANAWRIKAQVVS